MARRSKQEWAEIVASYEASGLSQDAFARSEGVAASTLRYWLYKLRQERSEGAFASTGRFIEITPSSEEKASGGVGVVVRVGEGVMLELGDLPEPAYLAELARALAC